eukprot:COSAG02_NODE_5175_length_4571_cov_2.726744_4_plen_132_part_00
MSVVNPSDSIQTALCFQRPNVVTPALNTAGLELHRTPKHKANLGGTTAATLMITNGPPLLCTGGTSKQTVRDREHMDHAFAHGPPARFQHHRGAITDDRPDGMQRVESTSPRLCRFDVPIDTAVPGTAKFQ